MEKKSKRRKALQKISVSKVAKQIMEKLLQRAKKFDLAKSLKFVFAVLKPKKEASAEGHKRHNAKFVAIFSGKGGTGKTTTTVNLGLALQNMGKKVAVVDANLETPNLSLHLEIPPVPVNLHYVLSNSGNILEAIYEHESGLHVVPAGLSMVDSKNFNASNLKSAISSLRELFDWVLIDCPPGLWGNVSEITGAADEVLVVTNPELPALVDSLKAIKTARMNRINIRGVVLNRVTGSKYDVSDKTVKEILYGEQVLAKIPYDKNVGRSIVERTPLLVYKPRSPASIGFKALAARLEGEKYEESSFGKILGLLGM